MGVQELGSFYSSYWSNQPKALGKFWNLILHARPIILVGVLNGISYNMRMMRSNLIDTLNAQDVFFALPQLPLYLALAALIPVTAPSSIFLSFVVVVMAALNWAQLINALFCDTFCPTWPAM